MKKIASLLVMFIFGVMGFIYITLVIKKLYFAEFESPNFWFFRTLSVVTLVNIGVLTPKIQINYTPQRDEKGDLVDYKEHIITSTNSIAILFWFICLIRWLMVLQ